jgi:oxygen-independent coproporphyrinogen-3 oxidase
VNGRETGAKRNAEQLYIHVPFCARRCSYCDFAIAVRKQVPVEDYLDGLATEIALRAAAGTPAGHLSTVYLGGGTPSRLGGEGIARLLDLVRSRYAVAEGGEWTIEVNPEDVTPEHVRAWAAAGITRASLGVQSFDARVLRWMHRVHSVSQVYDAVRHLRDGGLRSVSVDLIFALPAELERDWAADIDQALALEPQHLSVYGLTVEPATPLGRWTARGEVAPADEERYAHEFLLAHERLTAAGYDHYEVSNYAAPSSTDGGSHRARHNSAYWRRVPYLALGPGAHGFDGEARWWNEGAYARWLAELEAGRLPIAGAETPDQGQRMAELVYLGLRTSDGLLVGDADRSLVDQWVRAGWGIVTTGSRFVASPEGWLRLDALAAALTSLRSRCEL